MASSDRGLLQQMTTDAMRAVSDTRAMATVTDITMMVLTNGEEQLQLELSFIKYPIKLDKQPCS